MANDHYPSEGDWLPESWHFHPDPEDGPWAVVLTWQVLAGRAECVGVEIYSVPVGRFADRGPTAFRAHRAKDRPGRPMSTEIWRGIPIARFIAEDRAGFNDLFPHAPHVYDRGPRPSTVDRAREAAEVYRQARTQSEWTRRPTAAVAAHFTVSHSTAAKLVSKARELDFLPKTTPGTAASEPTPDPRRKR